MQTRCSEEEGYVLELDLENVSKIRGRKQTGNLAYPIKQLRKIETQKENNLTGEGGILRNAGSTKGKHSQRH